MGVEIGCQAVQRGGDPIGIAVAIQHHHGQAGRPRLLGRQAVEDARQRRPFRRTGIQPVLQLVAGQQATGFRQRHAAHERSNGRRRVARQGLHTGLRARPHRFAVNVIRQQPADGVGQFVRPHGVDALSRHQAGPIEESGLGHEVKGRCADQHGLHLQARIHGHQHIGAEQEGQRRAVGVAVVIGTQAVLGRQQLDLLRPEAPLRTPALDDHLGFTTQGPHSLQVGPQHLLVDGQLRRQAVLGQQRGAQHHDGPRGIQPQFLAQGRTGTGPFFAGFEQRVELRQTQHMQTLRIEAGVAVEAAAVLAPHHHQVGVLLVMHGIGIAERRVVLDVQGGDAPRLGPGHQGLGTEHPVLVDGDQLHLVGRRHPVQRIHQGKGHRQGSRGHILQGGLPAVPFQAGGLQVGAQVLAHGVAEGQRLALVEFRLGRGHCLVQQGVDHHQLAAMALDHGLQLRSQAALEGDQRPRLVLAQVALQQWNVLRPELGDEGTYRLGHGDHSAEKALNSESSMRGKAW